LPAQGRRVETVRVFDGDTLELAGGERLRLVGINAPEPARDSTSRFGASPAQPYAGAAQARLQELTAGGLVLLDDAEREDKYGRLLAHPFTPQGVNITSTMLREGFGFAVAISPNLRFTHCYFTAESEARAIRRGVWGSIFFAPKATADFDLVQPSGFILAEGEIESVHSSRRALWVDFAGALTLMIRHHDMPHFHNTSSWPGKWVVARGWVVDRGEDTKPWRKRWLMRISHPSMLAFE